MNTNDTGSMIIKEECYQIIGACMSVQNELGSSFLESVYQEALAVEFGNMGIPYVREQRMDIYYKDQLLDKKYSADFVCYQGIIVEIKVCSALNDAHTAQVLNYLSALKLRIALLVNFGTTRLEWKRVLL